MWLNTVPSMNLGYISVSVNNGEGFDLEINTVIEQKSWCITELGFLDSSPQMSFKESMSPLNCMQNYVFCRFL